MSQLHSNVSVIVEGLKNLHSKHYYSACRASLDVVIFWRYLNSRPLVLKNKWNELPQNATRMSCDTQEKLLKAKIQSW